MRYDWTLNISDLLLMGGFAFSFFAALFKIQIRTEIRLVKIESWMEKDGARAEKALAVLDTVGQALTRVTTLYESLDQRLVRVDDRVLAIERHHTERR